MKARSHTPSGRRLVLTGFLGALAAASLVPFSGCVGYSSYPNIEGAKLASTNPNLYSSRECMAIALAWVVNKFPPSTPATSYGNPRALINLFPGITRESYFTIADKVSAATNIEISPVDIGDADSNLPIYHVARVWLRHGDAKVDILRPLPAMGAGSDGQPVYQCITVILEGGFQPWLVKATHTREPGLVEVPPLYYLPDEPVAATPPAPAAEPQPGEPAPQPSPPPGTTEVVPGNSDPEEPPIELPDSGR